MAERNWEALNSIVSAWVEEHYHMLEGLYRLAFTYLVIGTITLITVGVWLNQAGLAIANFVLAAIFLGVLGFVTVYPAGLLLVAGFGGLEGLPKGWSINQLLREGVFPDLSLSNVAAKAMGKVREYLRYSAHVAYFAIVVFTAIGTWYIRNAVAILPIFIMLAGLGLWAVLSRAVAKWYYRITFLILLSSLVMFLYYGFFATTKGAGSWSAAKAPTATEIAKAGKAALGSIGSGAAGWTTVEIITCPMGRVTWEKSAGWCYTKAEMPPGRYRLTIRVAEDGMWTFWLEDGTYKSVPSTGVWLSSWIGSPFYDEFLAEAPVNNERVGALIGRVGPNGLPFAAFYGREFDVDTPARIGVGLNLPEKEVNFANNLGRVVVRVERAN